MLLPRQNAAVHNYIALRTKKGGKKPSRPLLTEPVLILAYDRLILKVLCSLPRGVVSLSQTWRDLKRRHLTKGATNCHSKKNSRGQNLNNCLSWINHLISKQEGGRVGRPGPCGRWPYRLMPPPSQTNSKQNSSRGSQNHNSFSPYI